MLKLSAEAKVGLFVIVGVLLLAYMSLRLGGFQIGREEGFTITVRLDSTAGLDQDASVRVAGVEVGRVKEIKLENNKAKLILRIHAGTQIGNDFTAVLKTKGLLGEKYLDLVPGSPHAALLEDGGEITRVTEYSDIDKLITILSDVSTDIKTVSESLSAVLGGKEGETTLRNIVNNIEDITFRVERIVRENDEKMVRIMTNIDTFATSLKEGTPDIMTGLKEVADNLNQVIEENRDNLKTGVENLKTASVKLEQTMDTLASIAEDVGPRIQDTADNIASAAAAVEDTASEVGKVAKKIDEGEGTLGKLVNDPAVHENLKTTLEGVNKYIEKTDAFRLFVGYTGEYIFDASETKSYFSLKIQPKEDKYYLVEVVDDPRGDRDTQTITEGGVTREIVTTSDDLKFSAQIAKSFGNLTLRGGLIENTGGVGVEYNFLKDRLNLSLDAYDFDNERNPHLKAGATYRLGKYFYLSVGYDDFVSKVGLESAFIGLGFRFEDEDLKYLFSSAPPISF
jgi:phospholipid/cholesterol/gamma-HCH transport system substrate-binding protein